MTARSYVVTGTSAAAVGRDEATAAIGNADLVWVHLDGTDPTSIDWLNARDNSAPVGTDGGGRAVTR